MAGAAEATLPKHQPLAVATRGDAVENVYYGSVVAVDAAGRVVLALGDVDFPVFTRSTLKPFQALPFVLAHGPAAFGFGQEHVALLCASHSGEPRHTRAVAEMLAKIGCTEHDLKCGTHVPLLYEAQGLSPPPDLVLSPLQHNCSGKHAGFLSWCRQHDEPVANYLDTSHPLQVEIRAALASLFECADADLKQGVDGCGAPNYAVPLLALARAYRRLAFAKSNDALDAALASLFGAMTAQPEMISGLGRFDLAIANRKPRAGIAKSGAEAVQAIAFTDPGIAIAIKLAAGHPQALKVTIARVLEKLNLIDGGSALAAWRTSPLTNNAGAYVGVIAPAF